MFAFDWFPQLLQARHDVKWSEGKVIIALREILLNTIKNGFETQNKIISQVSGIQHDWGLLLTCLSRNAFKGGGGDGHDGGGGLINCSSVISYSSKNQL